MRVNSYSNTSIDLSSTWTSQPITLEHMEGYSVVFSTPNTSTAAGTFKLQAAINAALDNVGVNGTQTNPNAVWVDVSGSSSAIASGANAILINTSGVYYPWVRLVFTWSSGSGTGTALLWAKGAQS